MSIKLQRQIDQLIKRQSIQGKEINALKIKVVDLEVKYGWLEREVRSGMLDTMERVISQNLEIEIKTPDQKLIEALEGGS